jgi:hypothetical protein
LKIGDKIPAETAYFRSKTVSAVWEDWMVVCAVRYEPVSAWISLLTGKITGNFAISGLLGATSVRKAAVRSGFQVNSLQRLTGKLFSITGKFLNGTGKLGKVSKRPGKGERRESEFGLWRSHS